MRYDCSRQEVRPIVCCYCPGPDVTQANRVEKSGDEKIDFGILIAFVIFLFPFPLAWGWDLGIWSARSDRTKWLEAEQRQGSRRGCGGVFGRLGSVDYRELVIVGFDFRVFEVNVCWVVAAGTPGRVEPSLETPERSFQGDQIISNPGQVSQS